MLTGPKNTPFPSAAMAAQTRPDQAARTSATPAETEKVSAPASGGSEKKEDTEPSLIETIREQGLQAYIEAMQEQKKKELREKILREMGLSEEALQKMSPEARGEIEKMIDREVAKRMQAEGELDRQQKGLLGPDATAQSGAVKGQGAEPTFAQIDGAGVGLGPLLALQEADFQDQSAPVTKDTDDRQ